MKFQFFQFDLLGFGTLLHEITIKQKILENSKTSKIHDKTFYKQEKSTKTTIPLVKDNEFDYYYLIEWSSIPKSMTWIIFIPMVIFEVFT